MNKYEYLFIFIGYITEYYDMYNRHIKKEYKSYYPNGNIKEEAYYIN